MKAARFYGVRKPLVIEDVALPRLTSREALIKVKACGICHTDLHIIDEGLIKVSKVPITLGHEAAGEVVEIGESVKDVRVGDRVLIHPYFSCGKCYYCHRGQQNLCISPSAQRFGFTVDGGFAEFAKAPAQYLLKLPDNVPFEACILADAGATTYRAVREVGRVRLNETVLIMGVGGLGLCALQIAKLSGAKVIAVDVVKEKLNIAKELGADEVIDAKEQQVTEEVMKLTNGEGVDVAFEFVARAETMKTVFDTIRRGGRIVFVGYSTDTLQIEPLRLIRDELKVLGSRASSIRELSEVLNLVKDGKFNLQKIISLVIPLENVNYGLDLLRKGLALRVIVRP